MQKGFSHALVKKEAYSQLNYPTKGIRDCPLRLEKATVEEYTMHAGMSPFEMQDILLPSGTNGVKDLHISVSHSSSLALFASLGKKLSVLSLDSGNLVVNYDLQFNRGTSAMQHYVATRPMFIDVEIMNADTKLVLGDLAGQASPSNVARGLSSLYKEITDTVHKEAATITAVFPSPSEVMSILVQLFADIGPCELEDGHSYITTHSIHFLQPAFLDFSHHQDRLWKMDCFHCYCIAPFVSKALL
ncbi:hypothetical protein GLYMA_07G162100v4 [Glycine max]|nr:uncharacterized protein LOC100803516 isoform X2 [Glycine max]XP_028240635.1 uncharacterized protein LOC114419187 isoform X2 [Glycine soja]KAG4400921.1 hypothetical protein GLYMA_07G162100v4 [Glycine max]KAH1087125.1 hypothetical protein GYH30_018595 [Glycine max]|eukprot:XP_014633552.1 uncharacterized protein LOC100803516 isoform X2 [Glycine max]